MQQLEIMNWWPRWSNWSRSLSPHTAPMPIDDLIEFGLAWQWSQSDVLTIGYYRRNNGYGVPLPTGYTKYSVMMVNIRFTIQIPKYSVALPWNRKLCFSSEGDGWSISGSGLLCIVFLTATGSTWFLNSNLYTIFIIFIWYSYKKLQKYDLFLEFHCTFKFASLVLLGLWI